MKIANKISVSFLITGLMLTIIAGSVFYTISRDNLENAIVKHLESMAQSRLDHIAALLNLQKERMVQLSQSGALYNFLQGIGQDPDGTDKSAAVTDRMVRTKKAAQWIYEVFLLNGTGTVVVSSDAKHVGLDRSTDAYFLGGKLGPYIKDAYISETTGEELIVVSAPIKDRETKMLLGVVCAGIDMSSLNEITTDRTGLGKIGEIYLINKHGYMITSSRFNKNTFLKLKVDTQSTKIWLEDLRKYGRKTQVSEAFIYPDYRGVRVLGVHRHLPEMQWLLLAEIDASEAFAPLKKLKITLIIIIFSVSLAAWLIGMYLSRRITGPIRKLHKGTEIIGRGDLDHKVATDSNDEIGQLSRAFDEMTRDLKRNTTSIAALQAEINERERVEKTLRDSEEKYRFLVKSIPGAVYRGFEDWSVEFFDDKVEVLTGYKREAFDSKEIKWSDLVVEEDIESAKERFISALKTDKSYIREYRIRTESGDVRWIQERGQIIMDDLDKLEFRTAF